MILIRSTSEDALDHWDDQYVASLQQETSIVTLEQRTARFGQKPLTVLLTGLSGAGKSTVAYATERRLFDMGRACTVIDGQNMRRGMSKDLGFSTEDRSENLRRSAEVAKLMNEAGLICLCAFASPQEGVRQKVADVIGRDRFFVIHLNAPLDVCRERDQEGLYPLAESGEITNFPGISAPYEEPLEADLVLPTHKLSVDRCVDKIMSLLDERGIIF